MESRAPWLKAMENGGLGEARAKAFLMDRFWVLERSVDIEGADYLVQRRLTAMNFMDQDPPRLGVIQVKFIQNGNTSILIDKAYVCDAAGTPYNEFFMLVFTGREDDEKSYLLSSADIIKEFQERIEGGRVRLSLRGEALIQNGNYEILKKKRALDRIEHALVNANFVSNRRFLSAGNYVDVTIDQIHSDFLVPLNYYADDVRKVFFEDKKKVKAALRTLENIVWSMQEILCTDDPEEAMNIYNDGVGAYVINTWRKGVFIPSDFFNNEDFMDAVREHKKKLGALRKLGLEASYVDLLERYESAVMKYFKKCDFSTGTGLVSIRVTYEFATLDNPSVEITESSEKPEAKETEPGEVARGEFEVKESVKGRQVIIYDLEKSIPRFLNRKVMAHDEVVSRISKHFYSVGGPFQHELDALLFLE